MLLFLLACAVPPEAADESDPPIAVFELELAAEAGAVYEARTRPETAPGERIALRFRDLAHPWRIRANNCPSGAPIYGCPVLDFALAEAYIDLGSGRYYISADGAVSSTPGTLEGAISLAADPVWFEGEGPQVTGDEWVLSLPLVHLMANAPDGQRTPALIEVAVFSP